MGSRQRSVGQQDTLKSYQGALVLEAFLAHGAGVLVVTPIGAHLSHVGLQHVLVCEDTCTTGALVPRLVAGRGRTCSYY